MIGLVGLPGFIRFTGFAEGLWLVRYAGFYRLCRV